MSMLEIASLSENLGTTSKWIEIAPQNPNRIHPTEKPIQLYEWLLSLKEDTNFFKPEKSFLDYHKKNIFGLFKYAGVMRSPN